MIRQYHSDYESGEGYNVRVTCTSGCGCTAPADPVLMLNTTALYEGCNTITAGPNLDIAAPGDVTFRAGGSIIL